MFPGRLSIASWWTRRNFETLYPEFPHIPCVLTAEDGKWTISVFPKQNTVWVIAEHPNFVLMVYFQNTKCDCHKP